MSKLVSELCWAQSELKQGSTDGWQPGRGSMTALVAEMANGVASSACALRASIDLDRGYRGHPRTVRSWRRGGRIVAGLPADELPKEPLDCAGGFARFGFVPSTFQGPSKQGSGRTSSRLLCRTEGWPESNKSDELQCFGWIFREQGRERVKRRENSIFYGFLYHLKVSFLSNF